MKNTKIILLFSLIILAVLSVIFGFFIFNKKQEQKSGYTPASNNVAKSKNNKWEKYYDEKYKYSLEYPPKYKATPINEETVRMSKDLGGGNFIINGGVRISDYSEGPWFFTVHIFENPKALTLEKYLEEEDKQFDYMHIVIDEEFKLEGNRAVSYHKKSDYEQFPESEKYIIFFKDKTLFEIITRGNKEEQEKFLDSFKLN